MDYKELLGDREFNSPEEICEWMDSAATAITDLLARAEAAEADNKKLCGAMMQIKRTDRPERLSVVYELEYDSSLSHKTMKEVAWILFKALMKEDLIQRMHEDPVGPGGDPRHPVTLVCEDEVADMDSEKWNWIMSRFLRSERDGH